MILLFVRLIARVTLCYTVLRNIVVLFCQDAEQTVLCCVTLHYTPLDCVTSHYAGLPKTRILSE